MGKKSYAVEEFLERPKRLEEEIQGDIDHIASLRSIVERTTTRLSFTAGTNPSKDDKAFEKVMAQIADEEKNLAEKKFRLVEVKLEVEELINKVPDKRQRAFLRARYIACKEMPTISRMMDLPSSTCRDLRKRALTAVAREYE